MHFGYQDIKRRRRYEKNNDVNSELFYVERIIMPVSAFTDISGLKCEEAVTALSALG